MTRAVSIRTGGVARATFALTTIGSNLRPAVLAAVREATEHILTESLREVPRLTGRLANSSRVRVEEQPAIHGIVDYTAPYAIFVHEVPRPASSNGKWKYLEDPFKREEAKFPQRVADRVAAMLGSTS